MTHDESMHERRLLEELSELHHAERAPEDVRARLIERLSREPAPSPRARWALPALAAMVLGLVCTGLLAGRLLERRAEPELVLRAEPSGALAARNAPTCPDYPGARDAAALLRTTERDVLLAGLAAQAVAQPTARCGVIQRRYLSYVPPSLPRRSSVPVLLVLHGATDGAESMWRQQTRRRFDELASRNSFIVIYPSALPRHGAAPNESRWQRAGDGTVDDEQYLQLIVADLERREVIAGGNEVYLAGHAEGAVMALVAAAQRPDFYSGVAASMPDVTVAPPAPSSSAPSSSLRLSKLLLITQGELGASMGRQWALALGVPRAVVDAPLRGLLPGIVQGSEQGRPPLNRDRRVESSDMSSADVGGPRVRVLAVHGAGRLWPHPQADDDARAIEASGPRNQDFDGADETWWFFSGRGRPGQTRERGASAPAGSPR